MFDFISIKHNFIYSEVFVAKRPVFIPRGNSDTFVETVYVDFVWYPGMSISQKRKTIASLHESARNSGCCRNVLEISTKSPDNLGVELSAFNLKVVTERYGREFTVESAYQSSKVFEDGGPYRDLLYADSLRAKKDPRIKNSGNLKGFNFFGENWPLEPITAFYDWVYLNALRKNDRLVEGLCKYDAFTDVEFNPLRSVNCQAYSVALFSALADCNLLDEALRDKDSFVSVMRSKSVSNARTGDSSQGILL